MIHINGKADPNDIAHVLRHQKEEDVVSAQPCPISDYDAEKKKGKINPHVTKFALANGQFCSVFHVKPIYYEALDGTWRPMDEVAIGFGNTWIDFKGDWHTKMHPRYMEWLMKRMELLHGKGIKVAEATPYGVPITVEQEELVTV